MRSVYRALAYIVAAEVAVQAMAIVLAVAGLSRWVEAGGVLDKSVMESDQSAFPEVVGFMIHGINGTMVIPILALLLLISSFFARFDGAVNWACLVLLLVLAQVALGIIGHSVPSLGALHGLTALLLFAGAIHSARRVPVRPVARRTDEVPARMSASS